MRPHSILSQISMSQRGTSSVEYGLILAFIVLAMFVALQILASGTVQMWTGIESRTKAATAQNGG